MRAFLPPPPSASFRAYPLDGAMLYFHPPTGTHVRIGTAATRGLRRQAPRVAMFGITNACNLRCDFCSRDVARDSTWTVASAADLLHDAALASLPALLDELAARRCHDVSLLSYVGPVI